MHEKLLKLLEFDKIVEQLVDCAASSPGKQLAAGCLPSADLQVVERRLQETDEAVKVERVKGEAPFAGLSDTRAVLKRSEIGGMLAASELLAVALNVDCARRLRRFLLDFHEQHGCPLLAEFATQVGACTPLSAAIRTCIDEQAQVVDQASPALTRIRHDIRQADANVRDKLEQLMRSSSMQKMLQELLVTIRNERYVLPVKAEYRTAVNGIIHDQSASGATLYIEPEAVVRLNNKRKELHLQEEREVELILSRLSGMVAEQALVLAGELDVMAHLDAVFAAAKLARRHKGTLPHMNERGHFRVRKARHPLLDSQTVVPLDLQLGQDYRGIVVTGPNTGGKTVALKTVGLLSLMAMSGLFVPTEDGSELCVYDGIFADIGDEQSIAQNLSTFSGHMKNVIVILREVKANSLVLLDEVGAGTDPTEGAALAVAILEHLCAVGCSFVATTHYSSLKAYADERAGVVNASVEFDGQTLRPTYRLLVGVPGRSNALAIAERLGLPAAILQAARAHLSEEEQQVDRMLASLEQQRAELAQKQVELSEVQAQTERVRAELTAEEQRLADERRRQTERARKEAGEWVRKARAEADAIIAELREMRVKEHQLIEARHKLNQLQQQSSVSSREAGSASEIVEETHDASDVKVGDEVKIRTLGQKATVVELTNSDELFVQIGGMRMRVNVQDLQKIRAVEQPRPKTSVQPGAHSAFVQRKSDKHVGLELDVRGQTLDEALLSVDNYLSEVVLLGYSQVTIIHGVGTGVLRKGIQQHLKTHRAVKSHRPGKYGEGDLGVTIVEMR